MGWKDWQYRKALTVAKEIRDRRPGTANSDINTMALEQSIPWWVLDALIDLGEKNEQLYINH